MTDALAGIELAPTLRTRRTTADHVATALREAIQSGQLEDGAELNQVALAEHFGVSRVPVREALRQLQAEGLITASAHRRALVQGLTADQVAEIFDLRILLEIHLIEQGIVNVDDQRLDRLSELCDQMDQEAPDHQAWLEDNRRFHRELYEGPRTSVAIDLVAQLTGRVERYLRRMSRGTGIDRSKDAGEEHRAILRAVRARDLRRARQEVERHISSTRDRVLTFIDNEASAVS